MDMYDMFYNANNAHVNYKTMQSDFRNDDDNHETALLSLLYYSRYKMIIGMKLHYQYKYIFR